MIMYLKSWLSKYFFYYYYLILYDCCAYGFHDMEYVKYLHFKKYLSFYRAIKN